LWWWNGASTFSYVKKKGKGTSGSDWGSWRYLGKPECFLDNKEYPKGLLTLPIKCEDL